MIDISNLRSEADDPLQQIVKSPIKTIEYTIEEVAARIDSIDMLDESEIKAIIERQHEIFLNYELFISIPEKRQSLQKLFTNVKFLKIFNSVIGKLNLSKEEIVCANKLCYDYYTSLYRDQNIVNEFLIMSSIINFDLAIKLTPMLGVDNAKALAMIYNSAFLLEKKVHRVHYFLLNYSFTELSIQDIVNIFCILFDKDFTKVFISLMLEYKAPTFTNVQVKRFDDISSAIIALVDSLPMKDIQMLLLDYGNYLRINRIQLVRFALKTVQGKERITNSVNQVEFSSGLIIP